MASLANGLSGNMVEASGRIVKRMSDEAFAGLKAGRLRLGTLAHYRKIECNDRRDAREGPQAVHIQSHGDGYTEVSADEFNRASLGAGAMFQITNPKIKFRIRSGGKLIFEPIVNVFVFCASAYSGLDENLDSKFGKNLVEIVDPKRFGYMISQHLAGELIDRRVLKINQSANSISLGFGKVVYQEKESIDAKEMHGDAAIDMTGVFVKPLAYSSEAEFRFMWFPADNKTHKLVSLPMNLQYLDLEMPKIWNVLKVVG